MTWSAQRRAGWLLTLAVLAAGCSSGGAESTDTTSITTTSAAELVVPTLPAPVATVPAPIVPSGSVSVGVWTDPSPTADSIVGRGVRELTRPQLWTAKPDDTWAPRLIDPGSEVVADDRRSVSFRLRPGAAWSDGTPIGAADLGRTGDARFVSRIVDGRDGRITVEFTRPLADWRFLWSSGDGIASPGEGIWGGPFQVASRTVGLETVLVPNPTWWGEGPFLAELRLVVVPDQSVLLALFESGELDVVMPHADSGRTVRLQAMGDVRIGVDDTGGWWTGLVLSDDLPLGVRRALAAAVDPDLLVASLLKDEAEVLGSFVDEGRRLLDGRATGDATALTADVAVVIPDDLVLSDAPQRQIQRWAQDRAAPIPVAVSRPTVDAQAAARAREADAAIATFLDVVTPCWQCRWGRDGATADEGPAEAAAFEQRLADEAIVVPLWRPATVVAWHPRVLGPAANGHAAIAAWNAWEWRIAG